MAKAQIDLMGVGGNASNGIFTNTSGASWDGKIDFGFKPKKFIIGWADYTLSGSSPSTLFWYYDADSDPTNFIQAFSGAYPPSTLALSSYMELTSTGVKMTNATVKASTVHIYWCALT